jgi:hypothetical protein
MWLIGLIKDLIGKKIKFGIQFNKNYKNQYVQEPNWTWQGEFNLPIIYTLLKMSLILKEPSITSHYILL